jgi:hypothetical protein
MKTDTRTMHQLLGDTARAMGDPETEPEEFESLAVSIRRRASQLAKDLEGVAASRRNGSRAKAHARAS